jgi:hypothetical protein
MALRIRQRQRLGTRGNFTDEALADAQTRAVHRFGIEAFRREQLEHLARALDVYRTHFGYHVRGDDAHDLIELGLGSCLAGHDVPNASQ